MTDDGKEKKEDVYITYPASGGTKSIAAGETVIDLYTGTVTLPDKTSDVTSEPLQNYNIEKVRSITIGTDQTIAVSLGGRGEYTIALADFFTAINQNFRYIAIRTTTTTNINIWASTHPEGVVARIHIGTLVLSLASLISAVQTTNTSRILSSTKASHFTTAIAQNTAETEDLTGLASNYAVIKTVSLTCTQQLSFRLHFYKADDFAEDNWLGSVDLDLTAFGVRYTNTGDYLMDVEVNMIYQDGDATTELHVALENLSATTKSVYATTETIVKIGYEKRD